jgi:hypothetical protein
MLQSKAPDQDVWSDMGSYDDSNRDVVVSVSCHRMPYAIAFLKKEQVQSDDWTGSPLAVGCAASLGFSPSYEAVGICRDRFRCNMATMKSTVDILVEIYYSQLLFAIVIVLLCSSMVLLVKSFVRHPFVRVPFCSKTYV